MARIAKSLNVFRLQFNTLVPNRDKTSDGWLGDAAHRARASDHNPNASDVVTAFDLTHDVAHGIDTYKLADLLRLNKDKRIEYVISNGRIFSSEVAPFVWRKYAGANKHNYHMHLSVHNTQKLYDDPTPWEILIVKSKVVNNLLPPLIIRGSTGNDVKRLQKILKIEIDGKFGAETYKTVNTFQKHSGLTVDGRVGPYTWEQLIKLEK